MTKVLLSLLLHYSSSSYGTILISICGVESDFRPNIVNIDDGGLDNHSFGLCQVSYRTAIELLGMKPNSFCTKRIELGKCPLFKPEINLFYAQKYFEYQLKRYNYSVVKAVSAYNAGKAIKSNRKYVQKVLKMQRVVQILKETYSNAD